ncbi:MAG: pseudouridylate synthase [Sphingobacteriaceae bacterium]|nr:pseudouridylate synthase [Sphingobacteriaceae bacterium]
MLEIIYQDEHLIAINKPHGLIVHRTPMAKDATVFALQELRNQIGKRVSPVHRLDRKTGGILLFAFEKDVEIEMHKMFQDGLVEKKYIAILRGYSPDAMDIDYPLMKENGMMQDAFTSFRTLQKVELAVAFGKHETSRYSLIEASPKTGRMHQLRKHFAHIFHPIIGDRKHGCNKQNKLFKDKWEIETMCLHASELIFTHPLTKQKVHIKSDFQNDFKAVMNLLNFKPLTHL